MAFQFLHTADWQIGAPFGGFDAEKQPLLRRARLDAVDRLADAARDAGAGHVLVAGDVYDAEQPSDRVLLELLAKLAAQKQITWHLLPGNHDPARPGGVWDRVRAQGPAANIIIHDKPEPFEAAPGVFILPAPLTSKAMSSDPTAWMDSAVTPDGAIRIGLAHGSVTGFDSEGEAAVDINKTRDRSAGLTYLALGDWHGLKKISARVWYSGTPEPDRFKDNRPGHALIVRLDGPGAAPQVKEIATAKYTWERRSISLQSVDDLEGLEDDIDILGSASSDHLMRLELDGAVSLAGYGAVEQRLDVIAPRLFHLRRKLERLHVLPEETDFAIFGTGEIGTAARNLQQLVTAGTQPQAAHAELALRKLFVMVSLLEARS